MSGRNGNGPIGSGAMRGKSLGRNANAGRSTRRGGAGHGIARHHRFGQCFQQFFTGEEVKAKIHSDLYQSPTALSTN